MTKEDSSTIVWDQGRLGVVNAWHVQAMTLVNGPGLQWRLVGA